MKKKLVALVVLYKQTPEQSETVRSILDADCTAWDFQLVIWDNSPTQVSSAAIEAVRAKVPDLIYISRPSNEWLSRLYNEVVSMVSFDYIMLLDQDTQLPSDYFNGVAESVAQYREQHLFLPQILNAGKLVSPGALVLFKGKHWDSPKTGLINSANTLAITSGMLISNAYLKKYHVKFDERLNLYGIDTKFMLEYAKNEQSLVVLPIQLKHDTVLWSNPSADVMLFRFSNLRKSWSIVFDDRPLSLVLSRLYGLTLSVKFALKYRDIRFLAA